MSKELKKKVKVMFYQRDGINRNKVFWKKQIEILELTYNRNENFYFLGGLTSREPAEEGAKTGKLRFAVWRTRLTKN